MSINLDAVESPPARIVSTGTSWFWLADMPEEEEASVKDSMTYGLLSKRPRVGGEANGFGGQPMLSMMDESKVYTREGEDIVIEKRMALVANKTEEKEGMSMGPMVTPGWESKDYLASGEEIISLVGKSMGMPVATSGGFVPQTAGVGQMKLEVPSRYSGKRQPGARAWLTHMECYMRLMHYAPTDWLDVVAMRVEGAASSWVNAILQM